MGSKISIKLLTCILLCLPVFSGCKKEENVKSYGLATIDNIIYGTTVYYALGFSFEEGKTLPSHEEPQPDITVHAITDNDGIVTGAYLDTPVLVPPFALTGEFDNAEEASDFYDNLLQVGTPEWISTAWPVKENQVWIFKTKKGNYAKFRVISILLEMRGDTPYAQISFQWKLQPDGSTSFGK
jgi:hypothetical protein